MEVWWVYIEQCCQHLLQRHCVCNMFVHAFNQFCGAFGPSEQRIGTQPNRCRSPYLDYTAWLLRFDFSNGRDSYHFPRLSGWSCYFLDLHLGLLICSSFSGFAPLRSLLFCTFVAVWSLLKLHSWQGSTRHRNTQTVASLQESCNISYLQPSWFAFFFCFSLIILELPPRFCCMKMQ